MCTPSYPYIPEDPLNQQYDTTITFTHEGVHSHSTINTSHPVTFAASFDAKGLAATGSGLGIGSAWVTDQLQGPDVRWITLPDTPRVGSEVQQRWMVMARDHSCGKEKEREEREKTGRLQGTN